MELIIPLLFFKLSSVSGVEFTADRFGGRPGRALNNYHAIDNHSDIIVDVDYMLTANVHKF